MGQAAIHDNRSDARMNLFMAAAITVGTSSTPVRVRDISSGGALVEGAAIPLPGARAQLCRAGLSVEADIVWRKDGRAGLRFTTPIAVSDWLPALRDKGQQRVDRIVHDLKKTGTTSTDHELGSVRNLDFSFEQLNELRLAIECLAEDLANDSGVAERHGIKLQVLDLAGQAFGRLAKARG